MTVFRIRCTRGPGNVGRFVSCVSGARFRFVDVLDASVVFYSRESALLVARFLGRGLASEFEVLEGAL